MDNTITVQGDVVTIFGGAGNDTLISYFGKSVLSSGGAGNDILKVNRAEGATHADYTGIERLRLVGGSNVNATGTDGSNVLFGNSGANILDGPHHL